MQIAIDGPAGAGKSTIAKEISRRLGYIYVDTGAMYRTLALSCIEYGVDLENEAEVSDCCLRADIGVHYEDGVQHMILEGYDVSSMIRREDVGKAASDISKFAAVRERLVAMQQEIASHYDVVMDGRDIGTKVLPKAGLKIYLTATPECRADRRYKELTEKGTDCLFEDVLRDIQDRDHNDMTREISPLCKAEDAIELDTSDMNIEEVTNAVIELLNSRL